MLSALYAIANPSVCLSRVDQSKTVEVRIMHFSPYSSPIPLVFALQVLSRNSDGIPPSGGVKQWWVASMRETIYFRSSNAFARWLLKLDILSHLGLHRISASAKPKFGYFSQIRPNSASAKFLAEFGRRQCNCSAFS